MLVASRFLVLFATATPLTVQRRTLTLAGGRLLPVGCGRWSGNYRGDRGARFASRLGWLRRIGAKQTVFERCPVKSTDD